MCSALTSYIFQGKLRIMNESRILQKFQSIFISLLQTSTVHHPFCWCLLLLSPLWILPGDKKFAFPVARKQNTLSQKNYLQTKPLLILPSHLINIPFNQSFYNRFPSTRSWSFHYLDSPGNFRSFYETFINSKVWLFYVTL